MATSLKSAGRFATNPRAGGGSPTILYVSVVHGYLTSRHLNGNKLRWLARNVVGLENGGGDFIGFVECVGERYELV